MPKIALGQIEVEWNQPERNLVRAEEAVRQAQQQGADVIVLPECLDLGWLAETAASRAQSIPGRYCARLQEAAKSGIFVAAGLTERDGSKVYNAAVLIDPDGRILLRHRKINELPIGQNLYARGDALAVAATTLGTVGIPICADNFAESTALGEALGWMGAGLLLSPCAWAVPADGTQTQDEYLAFWLEPYRRLAVRHQLTIVAVSNVGTVVGGPWDQYRCIGSSVVVDATGCEIARAPYGVSAAALVMVDVPLGGQGRAWRDESA